MSSGIRTKLLLIQVLEYSGKFRPLTPINRQIALLEALFEADGVWLSRISEGLKGRAGPATEARLRERAEKLNLIPRTESPWLANTRPRAQGEALTRTTRESNDGDQIDILRAGAERLARSDPEFAAALQEAIRRIESG